MSTSLFLNVSLCEKANGTLQTINNLSDKQDDELSKIRFYESLSSCLLSWNLILKSIILIKYYDCEIHDWNQNSCERIISVGKWVYGLKIAMIYKVMKRTMENQMFVKPRCYCSVMCGQSKTLLWKSYNQLVLGNICFRSNMKYKRNIDLHSPKWH